VAAGVREGREAVTRWAQRAAWMGGIAGGGRWRRRRVERGEPWTVPRRSVGSLTVVCWVSMEGNGARWRE
jgi:hypothetical protein